MTILHVTDFHYNTRWFDWLLDKAPPHDLLAISGDLLDLTAATPHRRQIAWVSAWLNDYPRALCVCSGNHDLEWDEESERWAPAYWLRDLVNPNVRIDGQRIVMDGLSVLSLGCTSRPKGGRADVWVTHAAPSGTRVSARSVGTDGGDPELIAAVRRHAPRLVLSGHVHDPVEWRHATPTTLYLNPGRSPNAAFPNHILVSTERMECLLATAACNESTADTELTSGAENSGALTAA